MFGGKPNTNVVYWNVKDLASIVIGAVGTVGMLKIAYDANLTDEERKSRQEASLVHRIKKKVESRICERFDL